MAKDECFTLEASWETIKKVFSVIANSNPSPNKLKNINKLTKIRFFKHLSESKLIQLNQIMKKEKFREGDCIFKENTVGDKFYMIKKGRVLVTQNSKILREMEEGNCFGELSLLNEEKRTATVYAATDVTCYTLSKEIFVNFLVDEKLNDFIKTKICLEDTAIDLSELYYLSYLGKGKFGTVCLVHNGISLYAVKIISKRATERKRSLAKYLITEKSMLLCIDHPFIVKLVKTLKNSKYCFFLMEFINGKNMEEYLSSHRGRRILYEAQFYGASLLTAIDYLNKKMIIHRDIKPSNIMLDTFGYIRLIDFGTAKQIKDFTHTVTGTPHFIAPEILLGKGYSFPIDYWSIGVCMHYIYYGNYPFGNKATDIMDIYNDILEK